MATLTQKTPTTECARCHRKFSPGDRVFPAYIVTKIGRNMETQDMGAWLSEDFELVHASCPDPALEGKIISLV